MKYQQYIISALITGIVSVAVGYYFYKKYQPGLQATVSLSNALTGFEDEASSIWNSISSIWSDSSSTPSQGGF